MVEASWDTGSAPFSLDEAAHPPAASPLGPGALHVWKLDVEAVQEERLSSILSPPERERSDRFRFASDRRAFVVTRAAVRLLLSRYLRCAPAGLRFEYGDAGKPSIVQTGGGHLEFSVSHSAGLALIALAPDRVVGVDLEQVRTIHALDAVAKKVLTPSEAGSIARVPEERRCEEFLSLWVRKEALIKATGHGIAHMSGFELPLDTSEPVFTTDLPDPCGQAHRWSFVALPRIVGYCSAAAVPGDPPTLRCFGLRWGSSTT